MEHRRTKIYKSSYKFHKIWQDLFDRDELGNKWIRQILPGVESGNNELEYYTNSVNNSFIKNGKLFIRVIKENYMGYNYTSAKLVTKQGFKYGFISVKAKVPKAKGLWPAIWMLSLRYNPLIKIEGDVTNKLITGNKYGVWAACGEIDIMETINSVKMEPNIYTTLHFGGEYPNNRQYPNPPENIHGPIDWSKYHIYSVERTPEYIAWYLDAVIKDNEITGGILLQKVYKDNWFTSQTGTNIVGATPAPFDDYLNLILNVAIGGDFPCQNGGCPPDDSSLPAEMIIDWVKAYELCHEY